MVTYRKLIYIFLIIGLTHPAMAAIDRRTPLSNVTDIACRDLKKSFLRVSVHGSNLRHFRVTKTPSGEPYQALILRCHRKNCYIAKEAKYINRYLPEHPHANNKGFVRYPDINPQREQTALRAAVMELSALARRQACGSSLDQTPDGMLIKYHLSQKVESDVFNINQNRQIISWVRNFRNGKSVILSFEE